MAYVNINFVRNIIMMMKPMNRIITATLALLAMTTAAQAELALRLEMRDGGINTYRFADVSKWRINGSDLEILRGDGSSEALFAVGDVKAVTYGEASDVSSIDMPQLSVSLRNGVLQIDGIGENALVSVIAADGRSVLNAAASGSFQADMRGVAPGVYILTVDGKSVLKFVLR